MKTLRDTHLSVSRANTWFNLPQRSATRSSDLKTNRNDFNMMLKDNKKTFQQIIHNIAVQKFDPLSKKFFLKDDINKTKETSTQKNFEETEKDQKPSLYDILYLKKHM